MRNRSTLNRCGGAFAMVGAGGAGGRLRPAATVLQGGREVRALLPPKPSPPCLLPAPTPPPVQRAPAAGVGADLDSGPAITSLCDKSGEDLACHNSVCYLGLCTSTLDHVMYLAGHIYHRNLTSC
jgi:hypothetical protein